MRSIGNAVRTAVCGTALMLIPLAGISAAAGHGGMGGNRQGDHAGMKMGGDTPGAHDTAMGEKIYSGKVGPWAMEARLVDMKAQMEKSGVSAKTAAKFAGKRHLMLFLTDPKTGKTAPGVAGNVTVTGPGKASSSRVTLVTMGEHVGADVEMPASGKYTFQAEIESGARKGSATFSCTLK